MTYGEEAVQPGKWSLVNTLDEALRRGEAMLTIVAGRVAYSRAVVELPTSTERSP